MAIRKRGESWQIDYLDPDGKRKRKSYKTKKEATVELSKRISLVAEGRYVEVDKFYRNWKANHLMHGANDKDKKVALDIVNDILDQMFCKDENRRTVNKYFRMAIIARDGKRCVICGRNGGNTVLQVDHMIPFSEDGKTRASNLQTLCHDCNYGKNNIFK